MNWLTAIILLLLQSILHLLLIYYLQTLHTPPQFISASHTAQLGEIAVYRNLTTQWPAQYKWTSKWLSLRVPILKDVVVLSHPEYHYFETNKVIHHTPATEIKPIQMKTTSFFQQCQQNKYLWHSSSLSHRKYPNDTKLTLETDVQPIDQFVVDNNLASVNSWMGCRNVTTKLHRDFSHNFFVQIAGRKEFLLIESSRLLPMYPYTSSSYLHPLELDSKTLNQLQPIRIVLNPGDGLYLPPLTYHEVKVIDEHSISINVWSRSKEETTLDHILYGIPLPFEESWKTSSKRMYGALKYLSKILKGNLNLKEWYVNRWKHSHINSSTLMTEWLALFQQEQKVGLSLFNDKFITRAEMVHQSIATNVTAKTHHVSLLYSYCDEVITYACRDCWKDSSDNAFELASVISQAIDSFIEMQWDESEL